MILKSSDLDFEKLEEIKAEERVLRHAKYSKGVVTKPWGYEYLWFELSSSAGWILWLGPDDNTSMHCHAKKTTALTVISGDPEITGFNFCVRPKVGEVIYIEAGCFHRTKNLSSEHPLCIMEIETPIDKEDLFRSSDGYGRSHSRYEAIDSWGDDPRGLNKYRRVEFVAEEMLLPSDETVSSGCLSEVQDIRYAITYRRHRSESTLNEGFSINLDAILRQCKKFVGETHQTMIPQGDIVISWQCYKSEP